MSGVSGSQSSEKSSNAAHSSPGQSVLVHLIETIAKSLVDAPEQVHVNEIVGENTTVIELKVAKEDIGKMIGKQGRTAQAVRTVLNGASTKLRKRTVLEIVE
ncbi:MAG: hypothetical protein RJB38_643 [Pseudomonadota bacterium]|jgi:predicted RNA-binding protein YlqC (UPF0109 family)